MHIVLALFVGVLWGILISFINLKIGEACARKKTAAALSSYNTISRLVSFGAFLVIFAFRNLIPLHTASLLIGTALSLSSLGIFFTLKVASMSNKE